MAGFPPLSHFRKSVGGIGTSVFTWGIGSACVSGSDPEGALLTRKVPQLDGLSVVQLAVSRDVCLALTANNEVYSVSMFDERQPPTKLAIVPDPPKLSVGSQKRVTKVVCCSDAFFALTSSNELYSWGADPALLGREVSNAAPMDVPHPLKVDFLFEDVCAGTTHLLALSTEGHVYSWGAGRSGRLGQACEENESFPSVIGALNPYRVTTISCGWGHSAVLTADARAFVWGKNDSGQLGLGPNAGNVDTPRVVRALTSVRLVAVACGAFHTAFLTELGQVYVAGEQLAQRSDSPVLVPLESWCVDIACGPFHTVAVCQRVNGRSLFAWGKNTSGELGCGEGNTDQPLPVALHPLEPHVVLHMAFAMNCGFAVVLDPDMVSEHKADIDRANATSTVVVNKNALSKRKQMMSPSAFSRRTNTEAMVANGTDVWAWGAVERQLEGLAALSDAEPPSWCAIKPKVLGAFGSKVVVAMASTTTGSVFLCADGTVHTLPFVHSAPEGASPPELVPTHIKSKVFMRQAVRHVACNSSACFAVCENGFVFSWHWEGAPLRPLLLGRDSSEADLHTPQLIHSVSNAVVVACGESHVLVLREDMQVMAWGMGRHGQLGNASKESRKTPQRIKALQPYRIMDVAAGTDHSVAVAMDGKVFTWGRGQEGQLGLGGEGNVELPVEIEGVEHVIKCAAGGRHTALLTNRGELFVCGMCYPNKKLLSPVQVKLPFWCVSMFAGDSHTVAVCENPDGTGKALSCYVWGSAADGALGLADMEVSNSPQLIKSLEGVQVVDLAFSEGVGLAVVTKRAAK